ncbi:MAG: class I SAM-dependent methyltransferase [Anaerolineales bacterium]|nr:class I SAM-dependent methyltransferase [Anaerolineales bacterium]
MKGHRVDYDALAATYDRRFSRQRRCGESEALLELARSSGARQILEAGCGTAHWLARLYRELGAQVALYGLDLSGGMLAQASRCALPLRLLCGRAEQMPLAPQSFDLVYCLNAIHHFEQPRAFIHEARRLLRPGGALAIIGTDPRGRQDKWYLYDYFAGTFETDLARFPSWGTMLDWLIGAGFQPLTLRLVEHIHAPKLGEAVLDDPFLRKEACSQLALLDDQAYQAGIQRIKQALASARDRGECLVFATDIYLYMLTARLSAEDDKPL